MPLDLTPAELFVPLYSSHLFSTFLSSSRFFPSLLFPPLLFSFLLPLNLIGISGI